MSAIALAGVAILNAVIVWTLGSELRWRASENLKVVDTGTSVAVLWTKLGGSSIAMDCLPGMVPQISVSRGRIFADFPLWIPPLLLGGIWLILACCDRRRLRRARGA